MTVSNQTARTSATGTNTVGQEISYSFPTNASTDLVVKTRITTTGVEATLTLTSDYTATVSDTGGTVTMVAAIPVTKTIHIIRNTPNTQSLDLVSGGSFDPENVEDSLDKVTKLSIENKDALTRTLRVPTTDAISAVPDLDNSVDRKGKYLFFDASTGAPTVASAVDLSAITVSAFAETYLDDATALATMATLQGVSVINVKNAAYGATGDGATDDRDAINTAALAAAGGTLFFPAGDYKVSSNLTIGDTVSVIMFNAAILTPDAGDTVTIEGPFYAGLYQVFAGSGDVIFSSNSPVATAYPEWWGAKGDNSTDCTLAFQACIDAVKSSIKNVTLSEGVYQISSTVSFPTSGDLTAFRFGGSASMPQCVWKGGGADTMFYIHHPQRCLFENFHIFNPDGAANVKGMEIQDESNATSQQNTWRNIKLGESSNRGFEWGMYFGNGSDHFADNLIDKITNQQCTYAIFVDATNFDNCHISDCASNGGGSAADGSDAVTTSFFKGDCGNLMMTQLDLIRSSSWQIETTGGNVFMIGGWSEKSQGLLKVGSGGSSVDVSEVRDYRLGSNVKDGDDRSIFFIGSGIGESKLIVAGTKFNGGNIFLNGTQGLIQYGNTFLNGAIVERQVQRVDLRFTREPLGSLAPHWIAFEVAHTDLDAAALTDTFDLTPEFSSGMIIHDAALFILDSDDRFVDDEAGVSAVTMEVGITGDDVDGFIKSVDVEGQDGHLVTDDTADLGEYLFDATHKRIKKYLTATTTVTVKITCTGGNCDELDQGIAQVYLLVSDVRATELV